MLSQYSVPIVTGLLFLFAIAWVIWLPYMIYSYRRYGFVSMYRFVVFFAVIYYFLVAFFLVILPLPEPGSYVPVQPQFIPFEFVLDIIREQDGFSVQAILTNPAIWVTVFNVLLLLPLGFFGKYYFHKRFVFVAIFSFLTSLFFEITQLTGIFGIYDGAYRLFDVDDLILNTLGGCLGYALAFVFMKFVPDITELKSKYPETLIVSYTRRFIAFSIDNFILGAASIILYAIFSDINIIVWYWICFFGLFVIVQFFSGGQTFGKWLLKIRVVDARTNKSAKFWQLLVKYLFVVCIPVIFGLFLDSRFIDLVGVTNWLMLGMVFVVLCTVALFQCVNRERNIFWDVASYTRELALPPREQPKSD